MASTTSQDSSVSKLTLALSALIRRIRAEAPDENRSLSWTQIAAITRLDGEGPMSSADLARAENIKPQSMGVVVSDLEALGIVERTPHPTDGRQYLIKLTPKGSSLRKMTREAKYTWFARAIAKIDKRDQATLFAAGEIMKRLADL